MPSEPLDDLCSKCAEEREAARRQSQSGDQPSCHALICRAFIDRASDAMTCVLESYGGEFTSWITRNEMYRILQECNPGLQPSEILHDVIARLLTRLDPEDDCYAHFPRLSGFFAFMQISIRNREIELVRRCRISVPLPPKLPGNTVFSQMEHIEVRVRNMLTDEEYMVWETWIYGIPDRRETLQRVGGENQFNNLKRRARRKIYRDPEIRKLLDFSDDEF